MFVRASRFIVAVAAVAAALFAARGASAHGVGLSRGEYTLGEHEVTSRLVFARHDAAALAPQSASDAAIALALAQRTRVTMGGKPCAHTVKTVRQTDADGLEVALHHACGARGNAAFHFDFVAALDPGHRHVAELTDGPATATFIAYKGNDQTTLSRTTAPGGPGPVLGFLWMGMEHILTGWDHLLFLLGVALLPWRRTSREDAEDGTRRRLRQLVLAVSAFTVAHSITLTLGVLGIAPLSPSLVEPLIALSIAAVGLEALFVKSRSAPLVTTFGFGLVHGMGFAGALAELELPRGELPWALGLFNLGVELGQLSALAPVIVLMELAARLPRVALRLVPATAIALTLAGTVLFGARVYESVRAPAEAQASTPAVPAPAARVAASGTAASAAAAIVERVCATLHDLPREKRAECEGRPSGISMAPLCRAQLSRAIGSGAIKAEPAALEACLSDVARRYDSCAFVNERAAVRPASCSGVLTGTRPADATCQSTLECVEGHICDGVGPFDPGVCRPRRKPGDACGLGIDPLAGYVHAVAGEETPECEGVCVQNRCRTPAEARAKG